MEKQYRKALGLEYFTVIYNVLEAGVSIAFGVIAGSVALVGFGLDSIVESLSGGVLIWRLRKHGNISQEREEVIEKRAILFVGITFFLLAAYVLFEALRKIITAEVPDPSLPGIILAIVSIIIMPVLGIAKKRIGEKLNLRSLVADAKETFVCSALSVALLVGLSARYFLDFWYADPIVGFIIVGYLIKEGIELVGGEEDE
jgi:divalent metal cation (Fe/Co/Zn/Cd) transporter